MVAQKAVQADDGRGRALIARWIEQNPHLPGVADARIRDYGVPVWALVGQVRVVGGGPAQVAADYQIPEDAVEAALAYYAQHKAVIDDRIAANLPPRFAPPVDRPFDTLSPQG